MSLPGPILKPFMGFRSKKTQQHGTLTNKVTVRIAIQVDKWLIGKGTLGVSALISTLCLFKGVSNPPMVQISLATVT